MQNLKKHEQFEIEVLNNLNSGRFLNKLVFAGGTMLRLCHGLDRYSVDMDFWMAAKEDMNGFFKNLKSWLIKTYEIKDAYNKHFTMLFEIRSPRYPSALKIEIRKEIKKFKTENSIAYSPHCDLQVFVKTPVLEDMMKAKFDAFMDRGEIRDAYDLEFLAKKGMKFSIDAKTLEKALKTIEKFTSNDYRVKLGSLLEPDKRKYYQTENFKILKSYIKMLTERPV